MADDDQVDEDALAAELQDEEEGGGAVEAGEEAGQEEEYAGHEYAEQEEEYADAGVGEYTEPGAGEEEYADPGVGGEEEEAYQQQQHRTPAPKKGVSRKDEYYLDEAEEDLEEARESREKAKKRKLKKEGKQSGGRLTKVRRRGERVDTGARDRGGGGGSRGDVDRGEPDGGEKEMWDQVGADSEDDQEGEATRDDEGFIDNEGVEPDQRYDEEAVQQQEQYVSSLPQAEEGEEEEEKKLQRRGLTGGARRKKIDLSDSQKALFVEEFQGKLERAAQDDAESNLRGEPAIHKLRILPELVRTLRMKHLQREFLDRGVFTILKNWLEPLPDWSLPNIKIRTAVLELLGELPIDVAQNHDRRRQLKESGLGKVVMFLSKLDKEETAHNRMLAKGLVDNWSRHILEKSTHFRDLRDADSPVMPRRNFPSKIPHRDGPMQTVRVDLDDVDGSSSRSAGPKEKRMVTRVPQPARLDFVVRPESKVSQEVTADIRGGAHTDNPFMRRLAKMKGNGGKGKIMRAEKVSVEGRGLRGI